MKKLFTILTAVLLTASLFAQPPNKMSYQAIVRNSSGELIRNSSVGMRISIIYGSSGGTTVYIETQMATTNVDGLVCLEIGGGIPVYGTFSDINWEKGHYFIRSETDPLGGTEYTISGTSELMSVPYALFSVYGAAGPQGPQGDKGDVGPQGPTGDNKWIDINDGINYADGGKIGIGTAAPVATLDVRGTVSVGLGTAPSPDATLDVHGKLSVVDGTQGAGKVLTSDASGKASWTTQGSGSTGAHYIGESYGGGIVFYVYDNGQHGLIAATVDQSTTSRWYAGTYTFTMALADGVGAGKANTEIIIANQGYGNGDIYAARICNEYSVTVDSVTYGDWYLPSKFELNLWCLQGNLVPMAKDKAYWSSSETDSRFDAWIQIKTMTPQPYPLQFPTNKDGTIGYVPYSVRAVRAF
jgi:hypothetical protein